MEKGTVASTGFAAGKAIRLEKPALIIPEKALKNVDRSLSILEDALKHTTEDLKKLKMHVSQSLGPQQGIIFDAHMHMVNDPEIKKQVIDRIKTHQMHPAMAYAAVTNESIAVFKAMKNDYFKARAHDIEDVQYRVLCHMTNQPADRTFSFNEDKIIFSHDVSPSMLAKLDIKHVAGVVTETGGITSHTAIMLRSLNIPALFGVTGIMDDITDGDDVILDGLDHHLIINPEPNTLEKARDKMARLEKDKTALKYLAKAKTQTKDGVHIPLRANIYLPEDIENVLLHGAEGIGLYRTDALFIQDTVALSEENQSDIYQKVFKAISPITVRTFDVGGDKVSSYLDIPDEQNPAMGLRGIRLSLKETRLFKTQIRALLQASKDVDHIAIMFPMIATVDELLEAKKLLNQAVTSLKKDNKAYQKNIRVGMMIEIPSTALNVDCFAPHVDFFSIGTNDLIQYLYAADRLNEHVSYLYQPYDPVLLRLIYTIITTAHNYDVPVSICGEAAGDETLAQLFIGLGVDELSMAASCILPIRQALKRIDKKALETLAQTVLNQQTAKDVKNLLKDLL